LTETFAEEIAPRPPRRKHYMAKSPSAQPPKWIKPQLTRVVDEAPAGDDWLNEIKYDEYRVHARLEPGKIQLRPAPESTGSNDNREGSGGGAE
jgi:ATP-dependent DNA ligase